MRFREFRLGEAFALGGERLAPAEKMRDMVAFGERLMLQLNEFETQLSERLREQEQKLAGWWSEAERLADERMRGVLRDVNAA